MMIRTEDSNLPNARRLVAALFVLMLGCVIVVPTSARDKDDDEDRYWVLFADHSIKTHKQIDDWHHDRGNPHIHGQRLFDDKNPALLVRDTSLSVRRHGAFVQLANGDLLPGRVVRAEPADPQTGMPERLIVSIQSPLSTWEQITAELPIRPQHCTRIVFDGDAEGPIEPGTILYNDGRKVKVQQVRYTASGVKALTDATTIRAAWGELAEVHPPEVDAMRSVLNDALAPCPEPESVIGRIVTSNGGVLTYRIAMRHIEKERWRSKDTLFHIVQPAWALAAIGVPFEEIASHSFRRADEVPLTALPAETIEQRSFTGFTWPWRRNANVRGGDLAVGNVIADFGLGTHSYSAIAFDLPPHADQFYTWIGIDNAVGGGGCVRCSIHADSPGGKRLWQSDFLRGGSGPVKVGPIDVKGHKRLVLVTDFAHDGRPNGADPVDIRDEVDWLRPTIDLNLTEARKDEKLQPELDDVAALFEAWQVDKDVRQSMAFLPYWDKHSGRWRLSMTPDADKNHIKQVRTYQLKRRVSVGPDNAWVYITAARDDNGEAGHDVTLLVNGEKHESIMNGDIHTQRNPGDFEGRYWSLGPFAGKDIDLAIDVKPRGHENHKPSGIVWGRIALEPIITGLPDEGRSISPDVRLASLKPASIEFGRQKKDIELKDGKVSGKDDEPLEVRSYPFKHGFAVPADTSITYELDPAWRSFVAVIGLAHGSSSIGPYEVRLDDKTVWHSGELVPKTNRHRRRDKKEGNEDEEEMVWIGGEFSRHTPGRQVRIDIPPGHKTITLILDKKGSGSYGAWANAGFLTR